MADHTIADDEPIYRRIPADYVSLDDDQPSALRRAFRPTKRDEDGLSVYRGANMSARDVPSPPSGRQYFVGVLRAGLIRELGMTIEPAPVPGQPNHCIIPELVYASRKSSRSEEWQLQLARHCQVVGPFGGPNSGGES